ncbi:MAG: hypothetical protein R2733_09390 [Acidimicrobiales bacterium]
MSQHWDELASAHLDGEATAEEIARLQADPAGRAAFDELGRIARANADVPAPLPGQQARHLDAALALFDQLHDQPESSSATVPAATTTEVADAEDRADAGATVVPFRRRRTTTWLAGAAAAAALIAGVSLATVQGRGSSSLDTETAEPAASPSSGEALAKATDADTSAEMSTAMASDESAGDEMADDGMAGNDEAEVAAGEADDVAEEAATFVTPEATSTTMAAAEDTSMPVAVIASGDDLFALVDQLLAEGATTATSGSDALSELVVRCPSELDGFDPAAAVPVTFDGRSAELVFTTEPLDRVMVLTRQCSILAADERR